MFATDTAPGVTDLHEAIGLVAAFVKRFEPDLYTSTDAAELVKEFARLGRVAAAGRTLAARRAAAGDGWHGDGHRSAREWLAAQTGTTASEAADVLATGERLSDLPDTEASYRAGELSDEQVEAVASAASADPEAERRLLAEAERATVEQLRRSCRNVRAAARSDEQFASRDRIHRQRYCRTWTDAEGAYNGRFRLTADAGAIVAAALDAHHAEVFAAARATGAPDAAREAGAALHADALVAMARASCAGYQWADDPDSPASVRNDDGDGGGLRAEVVVRVDHAAFVRGFTEAGEQCEIDGIGPVPVATARRLASDSVIRALLADGDRIVDVRTVGRTIPTRLRVALAARDRCCVVPGCGATRHLEIHHLDPIANHGPTSLANTCRICSWHHDQITYRGASLTGPHPDWRYAPSGSDPPGGPFDDAWQDYNPGPPPGADRLC